MASSRVQFNSSHKPLGTAQKALQRWIQTAPRSVGQAGDVLIDIAHLVPDHNEPVWMALREVMMDNV